MNDTRETNVSIPIEANLQQYTPQQIDDHCEKILNMHITSRDDGKLLFESVQIIKQLQQEMYDIESDMNDSCLNRQVELD